MYSLLFFLLSGMQTRWRGNKYNIIKVSGDMKKEKKRLNGSDEMTEFIVMDEMNKKKQIVLYQSCNKNLIPARLNIEF